MKNYFYLIFIILISCNQRENANKINIQEIIITDTLSAKVKEVDTRLLIPIKSLVVGDKFVVYDRIEDDMFKVFQLPELNYLYSFGKIGKGPNEFIRIPDSGINEYKNKLIIIDNIKYNEFEINSKGFKKTNSFILKMDILGIDNFQLVSDSSYIYDNKSCDNNKEYNLVGLKDKKLIKQFGNYPKFSKQIKRCDDIKICGVKINTARQSDGRIAALYLFMNKIKIFDNAGDLITEVTIGKEQSLSKVPDENSKLHRISVCSDEKHIYVLYAGVSEEQAIQQEFNTKFEIWNWEGELLKAFVLDKSILSFDVSVKYNRIYGTSLNDINHIYEYIIPAI